MQLPKEADKMKTSKKIISVILSIIAAICILGGIFYSVDKKRIGSNEDPIFAVKLFTLKDGGTLRLGLQNNHLQQNGRKRRD